VLESLAQFHFEIRKFLSFIIENRSKVLKIALFSNDSSKSLIFFERNKHKSFKANLFRAKLDIFSMKEVEVMIYMKREYQIGSILIIFIQ